MFSLQADKFRQDWLYTCISGHLSSHVHFADTDHPTVQGTLSLFKSLTFAQQWRKSIFSNNLITFLPFFLFWRKYPENTDADVLIVLSFNFSKFTQTFCTFVVIWVFLIRGLLNVSTRKSLITPGSFSKSKNILISIFNGLSLYSIVLPHYISLYRSLWLFKFKLSQWLHGFLTSVYQSISLSLQSIILEMWLF